MKKCKLLSKWIENLINTYRFVFIEYFKNFKVLFLIKEIISKFPIIYLHLSNEFQIYKKSFIFFIFIYFFKKNFEIILN